MGNCGVGFAPLRPGGETELIELMEGVEDIPGTVLAAGIDWRWETFGEYLDALDERQWMLDVGTQVPHAALRAYVMGDRAADRRSVARRPRARWPSSPVKACAPACSGSRRRGCSRTAPVVAATFRERSPTREELTALGAVLGEFGTGVFEIVPRGMDGEISPEAHAEIDMMGELARSIGRPVVFSLVQTHTEPDRYRAQLDRCARVAGRRCTPLPTSGQSDDRHPDRGRQQAPCVLDAAELPGDRTSPRPRSGGTDA